MRSVLEEVVAHLASTLDAPVSTTAPAVRPSEFVLVDPVGGSSSLDALHSDYAVQAWAETDAQAEELVREACVAMRALGATPMAVDPIRYGNDATHVWWQTTWTVHALW